MTLSKTLIPTLILLVGSGWAMAQQGMTEEGTQEGSAETLPDFSQVDADQNGGISQTEAQAVPGLVESFTQVDINVDGWLSPDEYRAAEQASSGKGGT